MKKIVRNGGEMIKVKKKSKILRGKHEDRVLRCSKIFKNLTGKTQESVWKTWKSQGKWFSEKSGNPVYRHESKIIIQKEIILTGVGVLTIVYFQVDHLCVKVMYGTFICFCVHLYIQFFSVSRISSLAKSKLCNLNSLSVQVELHLFEK